MDTAVLARNLCKGSRGQPREYSAELQQRPLITANSHHHQHTERARTMAIHPVVPLVRDEEVVIRAREGTACDPRAIARSRPRSRTDSRGHSTGAGTKAYGRYLRWSER